INSIATAYSYRSMSDTHGTGAPTSCTPSSHDYTKPALVVVVVVMATVSGAMSVVGVERLIRGRFTLFSMVRFLLRSTFVLILPLLSSMSRDTVHRPSVLFVLLWMLLVELMRKKVSSMARSSGADGGAFSRSHRRPVQAHGPLRRGHQARLDRLAHLPEHLLLRLQVRRPQGARHVRRALVPRRRQASAEGVQRVEGPGVAHRRRQHSPHRRLHAARRRQGGDRRRRRRRRRRHRLGTLQVRGDG
ncbi:hypothetical protein EE612_037941, partial [Oryza sativa]